MSDCRLKFKECVDCKEWNGNRTHCANICSKPYAAWDGFNRYMELEEHGLLIRLPGKIGDVLYYTTKCGIKELIIREMRIRKYYTDVFTENIEGKKYAFISGEIGKTVFLKREEAEAALAEMEGGDL